MSLENEKEIVRGSKKARRHMGSGLAAIRPWGPGVPEKKVTAESDVVKEDAIIVEESSEVSHQSKDLIAPQILKEAMKPEVLSSEERKARRPYFG